MKLGYTPFKRAISASVDQSGKRTVADRHRLASLEYYRADASTVGASGIPQLVLCS